MRPREGMPSAKSASLNCGEIVAASSVRSKRRLEAVLLVVLAVIVVGGGLVWIWSPSASGSAKANAAVGGQAAGIPVAVVKARRGDLADALNLSAEFRPFQEVNVFAKVSGYVREMRVDVGSRVKAGEVLAVLEVPELQDDLQHATAAVERANGEVARARAAYEDAHLTYDRLARVSQEQPNLIAQQEIDQARSRDEAAKAALEATQSAVREAAAGRAKYATMIGYARIVAPFDGVVTRRFADTGSLVGAGTSSSGQALVRLSQLDPLRLVLPVPASAVPRIRDGMPVEVHVQATGETIPGTVTRSSGEVSTTTRTMHVEVDVRNPKSTLAPGMYATATLIQDSRRDVLSLPVEAVPDRRQGAAHVLALDAQNRVVERSIHTGLETETQVEVTSGLGDGELVLVGARRVQPGQVAIPKLIAQEAGK